MKTRRAVSKKFVIGLLGLVFGGLGFNAYAQQWEPTINVRVTFYDFQSDRSNPEFEQPHDGRRLTVQAGVNRVAQGMVADTLDLDGKPVLGAWPYMNHGIRFWFRDWNNLQSYEMAAPAHNQTIDGVSRGYLERFRPFYMYRRQGDPGNNGTEGEMRPVIRTPLIRLCRVCSL